MATAYSKVMRFLNDPKPVMCLPEELETDIDDPPRFVAWLIAQRDTLTEDQLCNAMRILISLSYEQAIELEAAAEFAKGLLTHPSRDVRSRGIVAFHKLWVIPGRKCTIEEMRLIAAAVEAGVTGEAQSLFVELRVTRGDEA